MIYHNMKKHICLFASLFVILLLLACATTPKRDEAIASSFYQAVNGKKLSETEIPGDSPEWAWFYVLEEQAKGQLSAITKEAEAKRGVWEHGSDMQKIADLYHSAMDWDARNSAGFGDLTPYMDAVRDAKDLNGLLDATALINKDFGMSLLFSFDVMNDPDDASRFMACIPQNGIGLGKETLEDPSQGQRIRYCQEYISSLLALAGQTEAEALDNAKTIMATMKSLASSTLPRQQSNDPSYFNNRLATAELSEVLSNVDVPRYLSLMGLSGQDEFIVFQPEQLKAINSLLTEENLPVLKAYVLYRIVSVYDDCLTKDIRDANQLLRKQLYGIKERKADDQQAQELVQLYLATPFGKLYAERCFPESSKKDVEEMIRLMIEDYKERIKKLDWMSPDTKAEAVKKLDTMMVKVGYPEVWEEWYKEADITDDVLINNIIRLEKAYSKYCLSQLDKPVDRRLWNCPVQTVNAFYNPQMNDITFPAAFLQPPFYEAGAPREQNLGGIGTIIGHEISHAFDDKGAQYDENGNVKDWWTEADYAAFKERAEKVAGYYGRYKNEYGKLINGQLTLGEDVADLGGIAVASDLIGDDPAKLRTFFSQLAVCFIRKMTAEYADYKLHVDVHAPCNVRVDAACSSMDRFYLAYPYLKEGDGMYVKPEDRVKIW